MPVAFIVRDENRGVQKRPPGVVLVVIVVIVVIVIVVVVREMSQQQHTQIVRDGRKKGSWRQRVCRCACIIERKAASFLLTKDDVESIGFLTNFLHKSLVLSELHTHVNMFAVTTTPTSLSSSATRSLKNNKASSLSKRAKCSSIVVSSSSSSSSSS